MKIRRVRNTRKAVKQIKSIDKSTRAAIRGAFYNIGKNLTTSARQSIIKGPKKGKLYRIKGRKKRHRASAPGQPPANLSGDTQKSVGFKVQGSSQMLFGAGDTKIDYPVFLELGTKNMEPRPFLIRAIEAEKRNTEKYFTSGIKAELKR